MSSENAQPLRVLFLLQRPEAWGNVGSIWRAMAADPGFKPVVWLLPYNAEDLELSSRRLPLHRELLAAKGVQWVEWTPDMQLLAGQFDVAIFTHPYDRERPRALWFDRVRACVPKIVYVPYGLSVGAGFKNLRLQFAQPLQIGADLVVARSPAEKAMYARYCPAGDRKVQVLGHPRFDRLLAELQSINDPALAARIGGRLAFLWNSHFSFGHHYSQSSNFSSFDLIGPELLDYFAARQTSLCLLWRPHPALFPELIKQGLLTQEQLPVLRAELDVLGIVLDEQADHLPAFAYSQALISDPGSFWIEYQATGKPLMPLINPEGEPLNQEAQSLLSACGAASGFDAVQRFIESVAEDTLDRTRYDRLREHHLPLLDGHSGLRVCAALRGQDVTAVVGNSPTGLRGKSPHSKPLSRAELLPVSGVMMPPVVARLQAGLRQIRAEKLAQPGWQKTCRRQFNRVRTTVGEMVKQMAWLVHITGSLRGSRK